MSEAQSGGFIRESVPAEHDSSSALRASAVTVETQLQSGPFTRELHRFNV